MNQNEKIARWAGWESVGFDKWHTGSCLLPSLPDFSSSSMAITLLPVLIARGYVINLFGGMFLDSGTEIGYNLTVSGKEDACLHCLLGNTIAEVITGVVLQLIELEDPKNLSGHDSVATVPR